MNEQENKENITDFESLATELLNTLESERQQNKNELMNFMQTMQKERETERDIFLRYLKDLTQSYQNSMTTLSESIAKNQKLLNLILNELQKEPTDISMLEQIKPLFRQLSEQLQINFTEQLQTLMKELQQLAERY